MKTITLNAPAGFEFTGECRLPKVDEWFLKEDCVSAKQYQRVGDGCIFAHILKKIEPRVIWVLSAGTSQWIYDSESSANAAWLRTPGSSYVKFQEVI